MFKLTLVTPDKTILKDREASDLIVTAFAGELNILPGHAPLMTLLKPGRLIYKLVTGEVGVYFANWGYCQVQKGEVLVLAETIKAKDDLNDSEIQTRLGELSSRFDKETLSESDYAQLMKELDQARAEAQFLSNS